MTLKPQDLLILLKLLSWNRSDWSYAELAKSLHMSVSEAHAGVQRATDAQLFNVHTKRPIKKSLKELLVHGVKYVYPPQRGEPTRGLFTTHAAPPLNSLIHHASNGLAPVWPYPEGKDKGYAFLPLFKSVPQAVQEDKQLYKLLALLDAIRDGKAREQSLAIDELDNYF